MCSLRLLKKKKIIENPLIYQEKQTTERKYFKIITIRKMINFLVLKFPLGLYFEIQNFRKLSIFSSM